MGLAAERKLLEMAFDDAWLNGAFVFVPVSYSNIEFNPPINNEAWISFRLGVDDADIISLGNNKIVRHDAEIVVDIYVNQGEGTNEAREIADEVVSILRNKQFSSAEAGTVTTRIPDVAPIGVDESYYRLQIVVPYERDEVIP